MSTLIRLSIAEQMRGLQFRADVASWALEHLGLPYEKWSDDQRAVSILKAKGSIAKLDLKWQLLRPRHQRRPRTW